MVVWEAKQGDTVRIRAQLLDGDRPINLEGREVLVRIRSATRSAPVVSEAAYIKDIEDGRVEYAWSIPAGLPPGRYDVEFVLDPDTSSQITVPSYGYGWLQVSRSLKER